MAAVDLGRYKRIVQYFWDPEPTNDDGSGLPVWCLGRRYNITPADSMQTPPPEIIDEVNVQTSGDATTPPETVNSSVEDSLRKDASEPSEIEGGSWPKAFLDDFESKAWFSYRSGFPVIARSQDPRALSAMSFAVRLRSQLSDQGGFTSDTGWGCMIRSGQSLLANALFINRLGRDWRRRGIDLEERQILASFADDPRAPYSIHKFVEHGAEACGKHPGEWFGPSATAKCIKELVSRHETDIKVYITGDGSDVYEDIFLKVAKGDGGSFKPTLILVGTRLGIDKITPAYWEALRSTLQMKQAVGIAGGRPSSSHYFIGVQGPYLFYLDPHKTLQALPFHENLSQYSEADVDSCHTRRLRRIDIKEMDPSMLIGFLIRNEDDWREWKKDVGNVQGKIVIHVADHAPASEGLGIERDGALDEVESFDEYEDDEDETTLP